MSNLRSTIVTRIAEIAAAEKITKLQLGLLSREMLLYVPDSDDIAVVNRLLEVLTPVNKATATLFFQHFLPWESEKDKQDNFLRFGKKIKGDKTRAKRAGLVKAFMADESNTIWTWAEKNVEVAPKQKDFAGMLTRTVEKALQGDERSDTPALDRGALMQAIFAGGINLEDMFEAIGVEEARIEAEMLAQEQAEQDAADAAAAAEKEFVPDH